MTSFDNQTIWNLARYLYRKAYYITPGLSNSYRFEEREISFQKRFYRIAEELYQRMLDMEFVTLPTDEEDSWDTDQNQNQNQGQSQDQDQEENQSETTF